MLQMHVSTNLVLPSCDDGGEYDSLGFDEYVGEYGLGENGYLEWYDQIISLEEGRNWGDMTVSFMQMMS